jgi:hypothetical protein
MSNKPIFLIYSDDLTDDLSDDLTASITVHHSTFPQGMKNMDDRTDSKAGIDSQQASRTTHVQHNKNQTCKISHTPSSWPPYVPPPPAA